METYGVVELSIVFQDRPCCCGIVSLHVKYQFHISISAGTCVQKYKKVGGIDVDCCRRNLISG